MSSYMGLMSVQAHTGGGGGSEWSGMGMLKGKKCEEVAGLQDHRLAEMHT